MKTVIEMAREADACHDDVQITPFLERFAELVRADEREQIIDLVAMYGGPVDLEAAIRNRATHDFKVSTSYTL